MTKSGHRPARSQIVPSVLPADFARLGEEVAALEAAGVDRIQWDVMDGVSSPTSPSGPTSSPPAAARHVPFEAHLMVVNPDLMLLSTSTPAAS